VTDAEWSAFLEGRGLDRRGLAEEVLLCGFFAERRVYGERTVEAYERRFDDRSLLFDRESAVVIARELCAAGVEYDGGMPGDAR